MQPRRHARPIALALLALATVVLASGCDRGKGEGDVEHPDFVTAGTLPRPEAGAGSVTGMPGARAATANATPIGEPDAGTDADLAADPFALPGTDEDAQPLPGGDLAAPVPADEPAPPDAGAAAPPPTSPADEPPPPEVPAGEPTAEDAAAVVRRYYGAIDAGQYGQAYHLWAGEGRSSGQSAASFAGGFAGTSGVDVRTGAPGRVDAAAGSRYVRIPVTIEAMHDDGSRHRYEGSYTLRRAVVDGASAAQRDWRIESADLREVSP